MACLVRLGAIVSGMRISGIPKFRMLSDQERLAWAEEILGSLENPDALTPPQSHRGELNRRWVAYEANPGIALNREQFHAQVTALRK